eukprot:TRINITY_DN56296_c0_g1_i1.p1 TRINITY_DN56296_c0_g1~~TRINITY_DN56296_c0_g1_i1.p1  ORF type:complete len:169 (+),score=37.42 TRINITY_DN56296_c0_g1_i1:76-507(+)
MAAWMNHSASACSDRVAGCGRIVTLGLCATPVGKSECRRSCKACTPTTPPRLAALAAADPPQPQNSDQACPRLSGFCDVRFVARHCAATCRPGPARLPAAAAAAGGGAPSAASLGLPTDAVRTQVPPPLQHLQFDPRGFARRR